MDSSIIVTLEDQNGNELHKAKLVGNAEIARLLPELITALKLAITDDAGRPITYHLSHNDRLLQGSDTLIGSSVRDGDTLVIVPEMTAGAQCDVAELESQEPLVVLGPALDAQPTVAGFPRDYEVDAQSSTVQIWFKQGTIQHAFSQAKAREKIEVGGILVGTVYEENGRYLVVVENALEAQHTLAGTTFVTFTGKTWLDLLQQRATSAFTVVGWYHSHPGIGIFLSSNDEFIQQGFFSNRPWYIALVVDPISDDWGAFAWEEGNIKRCTNTYTV
jgi:proteasome lid subunit RPN8/RPN11